MLCSYRDRKKCMRMIARRESSLFARAREKEAILVRLFCRSVEHFSIVT